MIEVIGLSKQYGGLSALVDVSLRVNAGEMVVVLGPSGAGKSTLLRCINHLTLPSAGAVHIGGEAVPTDRAGLRRLRSQVGMIFQDHNLVARMSVLKNVLAGRLARMPKVLSLLQVFRDEDVRIALHCLKRVELDDRAWSRADRLSGGQQQRVGVARALAQEPRAILADEPVASLDPKTARIVLGDLKRASRELGIAVLCNLHQVAFAKEFADRVIGMHAGHVVFEGKPEALDAQLLTHIYPGLEESSSTDAPLPSRQRERAEGLGFAS